MTGSRPAGWKGRTRGGKWGYLFFIQLIRWGGLGVAYGFLAFVVIYFIPFAPKATAAVWRYSRCILGYGFIKSVGMLFRNYYVLGQTLIDKVALRSGHTGWYRFQFSGHKELLELLDHTGGVVVMGAHTGNWEVGAPFFGDYGKKMNIVMYDAEYENIKEILERQAAGRSYKVIRVNADSITHVFEIEAALKKGEYVCLQGDRFVDASHTLKADFMGKEARFPLGPFQIAARMGKAIVFYFAMREQGRCYHFHFFMADQGCSMKPREREKYILGQYVKALEEMVRRYPAQWFNYYDFWAGDC